jgi:4a-hydroxytetrahydrobiopterin dehydratase
MSLLSDTEITNALGALPGWERRGATIVKTFDRANFDGSLRFVNAVAEIANAQDHHPDIAISWNRVTLTLSSHDAGGITDRDVRLAEAIDGLRV